MNVRLVCMSCNDKSVFPLCETHSELLSYLVCFLRSDLTWFEGLPDLVGNHIAFLLPANGLLVLPFGEHEVFIHSKWIALVRCDKLAFLWILCVICSIPQALGYGFSFVLVQCNEPCCCHRRLLINRNPSARL